MPGHICHHFLSCTPWHYKCLWPLPEDAVSGTQHTLRQGRAILWLEYTTHKKTLWNVRPICSRLYRALQHWQSEAKCWVWVLLQMRDKGTYPFPRTRVRYSKHNKKGVLRSSQTSTGAASSAPSIGNSHAGRTGNDGFIILLKHYVNALGLGPIGKAIMAQILPRSTNLQKGWRKAGMHNSAGALMYQ